MSDLKEEFPHAARLLHEAGASEQDLADFRDRLIEVGVELGCEVNVEMIEGGYMVKFRTDEEKARFCTRLNDLQAEKPECVFIAEFDDHELRDAWISVVAADCHRNEVLCKIGFQDNTVCVMFNSYQDLTNFSARYRTGIYDQPARQKARAARIQRLALNN